MPKLNVVRIQKSYFAHNNLYIQTNDQDHKIYNIRVVVSFLSDFLKALCSLFFPLYQEFSATGNHQKYK